MVIPLWKTIMSVRRQMRRWRVFFFRRRRKQTLGEKKGWRGRRWWRRGKQKHITNTRGGPRAPSSNRIDGDRRRRTREFMKT